MDLWDVPKDFKQMSFASKKEWFQKVGSKKMRFKVPCARHNRSCQVKSVEFDLSGHCCKDYSKAGSLKGVEGDFAASMLAHFQYLEQTGVPIRASENVLSGEVQGAVKDAMQGLDTRYLVVAPEDAGFGSVRRDRGYLFGLAKPYKWIADPQKIYNKLACKLAERQVQQEELWCFDGEEDLRRERQNAQSQFRKFEPNGFLLEAQ